VRRLWYVLALAGLLGCQKQQLPPAHGTLEEQLKCSAAAEKYVDGMRLPENVVAMRKSHYSPRTGVCAVRYDVTDDTHALNFHLANAVEQSQLGAIQMDKGDITNCFVTMPGGETKLCNGIPEFDKLSEVYFDK
jgi:hypothetical protein